MTDKVIEIVKTIAIKDDEISSETEIISEGFIDSLSVFHIMAEIEKQFGIKIGVMDATVSDFHSPQAIVALIERVKNG